MQSKHKIDWKGYFSITVVSLAISIYIMFDKALFSQTDIAQIYKILCDAFFVPGILFACFGVMLGISNEGFFDIFAYSMHLFVDNFTKSKNFRAQYETYFDYTRRDREKNTNMKFVFHVGLAFLVIAIIFNLLFNSVYVPLP